MNISVVICSYNPIQHLGYTLDSLLPQSKSIYEVVVIIDNEHYNDYANTLINKYKKGFNLFTVHIQPNSGRAVARNKGAKLSKSDIILFLDDDMIAGESLVEKHHVYHLSNPQSIIIGNGFRNPVHARDDFSQYLIEVERSWYANVESKMKVDYKNFIFTACNLSVSAAIFNQLNGFDEQLKDDEDFDLGARAIKAGINIIYDRSLEAWHNDWPDIKTFIKRQNEYALSKKRLTEAHPGYLDLFPVLKSGSSSFIKKLQSFILRNSICWIVIKNDSIFKILPQDYKFSLYRLTISANSSINGW